MKSFSNNIKLHIYISFLIMLLLSMLLINMTIMLIWHQDEVNKKLGQVQIILSGYTFKAKDGDKNKIAVELRELKKRLGAECRQVVYLHSDSFIKADNNAVGEEFAEKLKSNKYFKNMDVLPVDRYGYSFPLIPRLYAVVASKGLMGDKNIVLCGIIDPVVIAVKLWEKQKLIFIYLLINTSILAGLLYFRLRKILFKPIDRLVEVADNFQIRDANGLYITYAESNFGHLCKTMEEMVLRIEKDRIILNEKINELESVNIKLVESQKEVIHAESLSMAGRLSAGLAHEIGNPLAIVKGYLEMLSEDDIGEDERKQFALRAAKEAERIDVLIQQLLKLSRKTTLHKERVEIHALLDELVQFLADQKSNKHIQFETRFEASVDCVFAEIESLKQIFLNCLLNSIDAFSIIDDEQQSKISISTGVVDPKKGKKTVIQITIIDNGCGIKEKDIEHVFEPFFTTKRIGEGTGLGLSVSKSIVENLDGSMTIESTETGGTCVVMAFPLINEELPRDSDNLVG